MLKTFKNSSLLLVIFTIIFISEAFGHGMSEAEKQSIIDGGNLRYIWIGATHMLSGYDHLAFVFGIIFFLTRFKDIIKYITVFTVGHSITLIFATFNNVQVNYFLIDAIIALSVCYIAFANLDGFNKYLKINPPNLLIMIGALGLIHGLGLSTRLQQLPLNADSLLLNIISFNVGIELGQISALAVMLLVIKNFRKSPSFESFSLITNIFLILAGAYLFLMQMHGYAHTSHPEEFAPTTTEATLSTPTDSEPEDYVTPQWRDTVTVTIDANNYKEYKLELNKDEELNYSWQTDGAKLFFDFHGEPKGDTTGYFESYKKSIHNKFSGTIVTPFEGTHGWYWKNNTDSPVTITLNVDGNYKRLDLKGSKTEDNKSSKDTPWKDTTEVTIPAHGEKEYGFFVMKGNSLDFTWTTDKGKLYFDLHAEPDGDKTGYFESFKTGTSNQDKGTLKATFNGTHGWYWKNIYSTPVVVTVKTKGIYNKLD